MTSKACPSSLPTRVQLSVHSVICSWIPEQQNRKPAVRLNHSEQGVQPALVPGHSNFPNLISQTWILSLWANSLLEPLGFMCGLCIRVAVCMWAGTCRSQRNSLGVFLDYFLPIISPPSPFSSFFSSSFRQDLPGLEVSDWPTTPFWVPGWRHVTDTVPSSNLFPETGSLTESNAHERNWTSWPMNSRDQPPRLSASPELGFRHALPRLGPWVLWNMSLDGLPGNDLEIQKLVLAE